MKRFTKLKTGSHSDILNIILLLGVSGILVVNQYFLNTYIRRIRLRYFEDIYIRRILQISCK